MKRYLPYLFLVSISTGLLGQELPPIQNYTAKEYNGEHQNWGISQSSSKNIYVANHMSLLEFDGSKWHRYRFPNSTIIRSVKVVGDKIYTGAYREFGFWEKESSGQLGYTSLSKKMEASLAEDEEFWDILVLDHLVLFQSLGRIYIYDNQEDSYKIIEAGTPKAKLTAIREKVFFQQARRGLFTIENGRSVLVSDDPILANNVIIGMYEWERDILIVTEDARFYLFNFKELVPWPTSMDLSGVKLYSSIRLKDGSFILGSIANGLYHIAADGNLIRNIDQAKGLNNNTVLSLFEDMDQNLWLGLDNGLSVINLYSSFNEYVDKHGDLGLIYTAVGHNGYLYLGTNQGLFVKRSHTDEVFRRINGTEGQVWNLQLVHSTLFCGHNRGTFVVQGEEAELVSDFPGTWGVKPLDHRKDLVLQGNYNGLSILENSSGSWFLRNRIEGFNISSRFFEMDSLRAVVNHEQKGLYTLQLDPDLMKVVKVHNEPPKGHGSNIFQFDSQLYYKTHRGIYGFNDFTGTTSIDSTMTRNIFAGNEAPISIMIPDVHAKRLWYFTDHGIIYLMRNTLDGKLGTTNIPMPSILRTNLGVPGFENISPIAENQYLIGNSNGYVTLDLDRVSVTDHRIKVNGIYHGDYRNISIRSPLGTHGEFPYSHNNLRFEYSVPEFDKYTEVRYQYLLKGLYPEWSEWADSPEITFSNLRFGKYEFNVRAIVGNTPSRNTASYSFTILRPWYFSNMAIIAYGLGLTTLFFMVHRLYNRYYRKKQESFVEKNLKELEQRKQEEKARITQILNEKLQNEIENKNRELAISTMSILKKNKFLYAIKSQLNNISGKEKTIQGVIKEIDRNINSEDDWKFFEDAFNNADKDFLKRITARHESLTNNDLKLCAYLRLNLSSKEIAPLLNISVKSVEMKRYRLRQKFNLPHQDNLIDYILNF